MHMVANGYLSIDTNK